MPPTCPVTRLHQSLQLGTDLEQAVADADTVFFAVPSGSIRQLARQACPFLKPGTILISTAKGIESDSFMLPSQILEQEIPQCCGGRHQRSKSGQGDCRI